MAGGFSVTISATDQVTATIDKINARIGKFSGDLQKRIDSTTAPFRRLGASMAKFGQVTGINRAAAAVRGLARAGGEAFLKVGQVVPLIGIIGSAASVAGVTRMVNVWAEWGTRVGFTAQRIGISTDRLSALQGAARLAGSSAEGAASGLQALGQTMYDAIGGRNTEAIVMFRTLGIAFQDTAGQARSVTDVLPEVADKIKAIRNPFTQAQVAASLFGGAADDLLPFLRKGSDGIREYVEMARRYGVFTDASAAAANRLRESQARVSLSVEGLRNRIAERLEPILTPMLAHFADWVATSPAITKAITWLGDAVGRLGKWIESIDWDKVSQKLDDWGGKIKTFLSWMVRLGVLPGLSDVSATPVPVSPAGSGFGENGAPTAPPPKAGTEENGFLNWGRNFALEPNPLHWTPWYHPPMEPGANAPNGVPGQLQPRRPGDDPSQPQRVAPLFGPQRMPPPGQAPGVLGPSAGASPRFAPQQRTFDTTMTPEARGLLDTIAGTESPGYNVEYGGKRFSDYSRHPDEANPILRGPNAGQTSTAAGRYQFLTGTWNSAAAATGAKDFSPASQDKAAWWLAQRDYAARTGRDLSTDLKSDDPQIRAGIGQALHGTWTSLPGGIEAGTNNDRFSTQLSRNTERESMTAPSAQGAPLAAPSAQGAPLTLNTGGANDNDSKSTVRLEFAGNLPNGVSMRMDNPQKVDVSGPLVERPQLLGAMP